MQKILGALALAFVPVVALKAQIGERRNDIAIGVNAGWAMNKISFDPTIKQSLHMAPTFGVTFRYTCERYYKAYCALQVEANFAQLGWKESIQDSNNEPLPDTYQRNMNYIQVPMLARLAWGREHRGAMVYVLAGPQVGYCIGESTKRSDVWTTHADGTPDRPNDLVAQYSMPIERKFDYGITGGLGVELHTKIGHFMLEGRYYYGLSDIYGNSKKDVFSRSNNGTIVAKLSYLFDIVSD